MLRRLDEIFCANYMVFDDVVRDDPYDVWIADEAWEVDYFLHENPEPKRAPYVWLTDFVGVLPIDESNEREVFLAACDIAVSHGGLSTTMELTASARPFLYFPLRDPFEQNFHVHHRLQRHRARSRMSFDDTPPDALADRLVQEIGRETRPRPVPPDGAARSATLIAEVL